MGIQELYLQKDKEGLASDSPVLMDAISNYVDTTRRQYENMPIKQATDFLLSEYNYQNRCQLKSCRGFGFIIKPGDICYIDFGKAYLQEIGFQHFGLVISVFNAKAFVIPMTSNFNAFRQAYDPLYNPDGLKHLMRLGRIEGLYKYSILFLNDGKFINTARVIDVKAYLDPSSKLFRDIRQRLIDCIQQEP